MCGINGILRSDRETIMAMNKTVKHRGPDRDGVYVDDNISLGHTRLSIIDLSHAADQPMYSKDGELVLVGNNEIYNYQALRKELSEHYEFTSESDTEVILAGYLKWGRDVLSRLNGMYAFALWDKRQKRLLLARDPRGIKPLYYTRLGETLVFSSEIKAILSARVSPRLNRAAFQRYMRLTYTPAPETLFSNIWALEPGHYLEVVDGKAEEGTFSYMPETAINAPREIKQVLSRAVSRQLISDRPVGVFLSGGMDSTVILSETVKHLKAPHTFSVRFDIGGDRGLESRFNKDAELACASARYFGARHHEITVDESDMVDYAEKALWHLDTPVATATMVAQYKLAREAKQYVSVVLGGDGGDEYFGGYDRYRYARLMEFYQRVPRPLRVFAERICPRLDKLALSGREEVVELFNLTKRRELESIVSLENDDTLSYVLSRVRTCDSLQALLMEFDREVWLPDHSLIRSDKMSMAFGLELRVPFLDLEITANADRIPISQRAALLRNKKILRELYAETLPRKVLAAPKRGWFSPGAKWLRLPAFGSYVREVLSPGYYAPTSRLFRWSALERVFEDHVERRAYHYNLILSVAFFQIWARKYGVIP